jgi:quercetin dioxygenase-like cupin family protein
MKGSLGLMCLCLMPGLASAQSTGEVEKKGQVSKIKLEAVVAGPLTPLNGKFKLRASEVTYEPGGFIGTHHHAGPGIRCVTSGELSYTEADKTTIYRAGDCFFESGDVTHTAVNRTENRVVLVNFEVLPSNWTGPSAIPVPK